MGNYTFNVFNNYCSEGIAESLKEFIDEENLPIIICVGSDLVLGDSLGPLIGTFLKSANLGAYIYGTLNFPITAKEIDYARIYIKKMHPNSKIIVLDAAVGTKEDVGLIRVMDKGIKPGLGVDKNFEEIGDCSIIGIVAPKTDKNVGLYNLTRLNLIYKMAKSISDGLIKFINIKKSHSA